MIKTQSRYQRIIRNGEELQPGVMDTHGKFEALMTGIDLTGGTVVDLGCNAGEMTRLAVTVGGAKSAHGVDADLYEVNTARLLNSDISTSVLSFSCRRLERTPGDYDLAIATGVLHYTDLPLAMRQIWRIAKAAAVEVVIAPISPTTPTLEAMVHDAERDLYYPTYPLWMNLAGRFWSFVHNRGRAASPDGSMRFRFHLIGRQSRPQDEPRAVVIYGPGGTGKTTRGRYYRHCLGFDHLELDSIFLEWRINVEPSEKLSVSDFVDELHAFGSASRVQKYLGFHLDYIRRWLAARRGLDVVIEGYDLTNDRYRLEVDALLNSAKYKKVEWIRSDA